LEAAGFSSDAARQDASVIGRHVLRLDQAGWILGQNSDVGAEALIELNRLLERRARHEPVAYLTGEREFYGRAIHVTPAVLIPRPESEHVIEAVSVWIRRRGSTPVQAVDVGTGSGCLAVTLALEHPNVTVVATDTSVEALEVARANARRLGAAGRVEFLHSSLAGGALEAFDVLVSNPPYVAETERDSLPPDVRDHEPAVALYGGRDGLAIIRDLVPAAWRALRSGGLAAIEIGATQRDAVLDLARRQGFAPAFVQPDLAGRPRVLVAEKPSASV
jgi:release factor glutamine methyltransferase